MSIWGMLSAREGVQMERCLRTEGSSFSVQEEGEGAAEKPGKGWR